MVKTMSSSTPLELRARITRQWFLLALLAWVVLSILALIVEAKADPAQAVIAHIHMVERFRWLSIEPLSLLPSLLLGSIPPLPAQLWQQAAATPLPLWFLLLPPVAGAVLFAGGAAATRSIRRRRRAAAARADSGESVRGSGLGNAEALAKKLREIE